VRALLDALLDVLRLGGAGERAADALAETRKLLADPHREGLHACRSFVEAGGIKVVLPMVARADALPEVCQGAAAVLAACCRHGLHGALQVRPVHETCPFSTERRDETCPVSTEGGTRRVQLVREGAGRGGGVQAVRLVQPAAGSVRAQILKRRRRASAGSPALSQPGSPGCMEMQCIAHRGAQHAG